MRLLSGSGRKHEGNHCMKIKVDHTQFALLGLALLLLCGNYWALFTSYKVYLLILMAAGFIPLLLPFYYNKSSYVLPWVICFLIVVFNRNRELAQGEYFSTSRLCSAYLFILASTKSADWIKKAPQWIAFIGGWNIIATIAFFFDSDLYDTFIQFTYRKYPQGIADASEGYMAGLADHYSQNGTYITIVLLTVWAVFFCMDKCRRERVLLFLVGIIAAAALLLTTKRAHLLFGIATMIIVYFLVNPEKRANKTFKFGIFAAALLAALSLLIDAVPTFGEVFERFQTAGTDDASLYRLLMWKTALDIFLEHSIFGIGWYGFRYQSGLSDAIGATAGCHNIYFELLCETGAVGFIIFMFAMVFSLVKTYRNINMLRCCQSEALQKSKYALAVSLAIQIFVLMYGMTGNPIYDATFCFYAVAVAINISFSAQYENC